MIPACAAQMCNRVCARVCARMILPLGYYDSMRVAAPLFSTMLVLTTAESSPHPPAHSNISRCVSGFANTSNISKQRTC